MQSARELRFPPEPVESCVRPIRLALAPLDGALTGLDICDLAPPSLMRMGPRVVDRLPRIGLRFGISSILFTGD